MNPLATASKAETGSGDLASGPARAAPFPPGHTATIEIPVGRTYVFRLPDAETQAKAIRAEFSAVCYRDLANRCGEAARQLEDLGDRDAALKFDEFGRGFRAMSEGCFARSLSLRS